MLRDTEANELSVLDVLGELRIELSSLQIVIGILKAEYMNQSVDTLDFLPAPPGWASMTFCTCLAAYQMESYSRLIPSLYYL